MQPGATIFAFWKNEPTEDTHRSKRRRDEMPHLLGIDIGTSGTKTLICDEDGKVLTTATVEYPLYSPKPGWSEQDPLDWWDATCKGAEPP
jgi:glycerol kinase